MNVAWALPTAEQQGLTFAKLWGGYDSQ